LTALRKKEGDKRSRAKKDRKVQNEQREQEERRGPYQGRQEQGKGIQLTDFRLKTCEDVFKKVGMTDTAGEHLEAKKKNEKKKGELGVGGRMKGMQSSPREPGKIGGEERRGVLNAFTERRWETRKRTDGGTNCRPPSSLRRGAYEGWGVTQKLA